MRARSCCASWAPTSARSLFERCGFEIEAFLREEYLIDGRYIDEVWMARRVD